MTGPRVAPQLEAKLEEFFRKRVRLAGGMSVKLAPTEAGIPDRLALFPGHLGYLVELKTATGTVSPIQKVWHERAADYGWHVHVLYGELGIREFIRAVLESMGPDSRVAALSLRG